MSRQLTFSIRLGPAYVGLTGLQAQLVDVDGANVGDPITTGFVAVQNGDYTWTVTIGDGAGQLLETHQGRVDFLKSDDTYLTFARINGLPAPDTVAATSPASDPGQTNAFSVTYDGHGARKGSVVVSFKMLSPPGGAGRSFDGDTFTAVSDADGDLVVALPRSTDFDVWRGRGRRQRITTPNESTYQLPVQLGIDTDDDEDDLS